MRLHSVCLRDYKVNRGCKEEKKKVHIYYLDVIVDGNDLAALERRRR